MKFILCVLLLVLYFVVLLGAPKEIVSPVMYAIAGWQVGKWIGEFSNYMMKDIHDYR